MDSSRHKRPRTGLELLLDTSSTPAESFHTSAEREPIRPPVSNIPLAGRFLGNSIIHPQTEEDRRFFELAQEALEATGRTVDPTIQDLLQRLQYALLPHGNPIRDGQTLRTLPQGRVDVHEFYERFPNMSNDIFVPTPGAWTQDRGRRLPNYKNITDINRMYLAARDEPIDAHGQGRGKRDAFDGLFDPANARGHSAGTRARAQSNEGDGSNRKETCLEDEYDESNQRQYACIKCSMTFRRLLDLKRHEKQHLPVLPNICDLCNKGFARKDALKRHRGTLTCQRNSNTREFED